ncbi:unknown [Prevotella sp. CAG:487]|nr:unknown [Prevotella sp. CAG:487]
MEYNDLNNTIAYSITSTIFRHGTIPDDTACFQSRDAKSFVSQATIRHLSCVSQAAIRHLLK